MATENNTRNIVEEITNRVILSLEAGTSPWVKPWAGSSKTACDYPTNAITGAMYNGLNAVQLMYQDQYADSRWLTYKQAQEAGGTVRKGEKSTHVVFWKFSEIETESGDKKTIPFTKSYSVFNVAQTEGCAIKSYEREIITDDTITAIASGLGVGLQVGGNKCFYSPAADKINMVSDTQFKTQSGYQSTALHELVHSTGHKSRLAREFGARFGNEAYAFEELVAELGSAFLCAHYGLPLELEHHASYLDGWLRVLKSDKRALLTASSQASKAMQMIIAATQQQSQLKAA